MRKSSFSGSSLAVGIAIAALAIAIGSTAVAAELITSSSQIRDNAILSRDIHDNTLASRDVQDGGLGANDLSAGARRTLRGTRGPRGARGRRGPLGLPVLNYNTVPGTAAPGAVAHVKARCPGTQRPVGGGANDSSNRLVINSSYPVAAKRAGAGWTVAMSNPDTTAAHAFTVTAVCVRPAGIK